MYAKFKILEPLVGPQGLKVPLLEGLCPPKTQRVEILLVISLAAIWPFWRHLGQKTIAKNGENCYQNIFCVLFFSTMGVNDSTLDSTVWTRRSKQMFRHHLNLDNRPTSYWNFKYLQKYWWTDGYIQSHKRPILYKIKMFRHIQSCI